jgi:hypothetical protein
MGQGPADEAGAKRAGIAGSAEARPEAGSSGCNEGSDRWEELAAGRLAARQATPDLAARHFAVALCLAREDRDIPVALEILIDVAQLRWSIAGPAAAVEVLKFVLAQAAVSPLRRARVESMLSEIEGPAPLPAPDAAGAARSDRGFWEAVARYGIGPMRAAARC